MSSPWWFARVQGPHISSSRDGGVRRVYRTVRLLICANEVQGILAKHGL